MNMSLGLLKFLITVILLTFTFNLNSSSLEGGKVLLQILDKITAKVSTLEINVNESINYGSLIIEVYACFKKPPEEVPEDYVLLKIYDQLSQNNNKLIFQGWMIRSSPDITPLEHPIYDLWLKDCIILNEF